MSVLVIDLGTGNLGSVRRSLEESGAAVVVSDDPAEIDRASALVLPGVGAFSSAMQTLEGRGWADPLRRAVARDGVPLLGVCLGMQLLAEVGTEGAEVPGLGLLPGRVERLAPLGAGDRIPHVGWNEVSHGGAPELFEGVPDEADFYFVHSYHFVPDRSEDIVATTPYCGGFVSAVARDAVWGFQFHPEKSSRHGRRLLQNFLRRSHSC